MQIGIRPDGLGKILLPDGEVKQGPEIAAVVGAARQVVRYQVAHYSVVEASLAPEPLLSKIVRQQWLK